MRRIKLLILPIAYAVSIAFALAENESNPSMELDLPPVTSEQRTISSGYDEIISVEFQNEDIREILNKIAETYSLNLVVPEDLKGTYSIRLRHVTWRQVLEVLLSPFGYTYIEDRNIILIKKISQLSVEPVDTRVFIINYTTASEVSRSLESLIDKKRGGAINVDTRSNALVITERPSKMNKIQEIIERLDRPTDQVVIEGKLFELNRLNEQELKKMYSPNSYHEIVSKMVSENQARFISNFSLTALDEETAKIGITEKLSCNDTNDGDLEAETSKNYDSFTSITVTPSVNSAGFIRLTLEATIQSDIAEADGQIRSTTRTISTIVSIKDGFTATIGDMGTTTSIRNSTSALPYQKQFVLFVTARTLNPDGFDYKDTIAPGVLHEMHILDHEIPGFRPSDSSRDALMNIRRLRNKAALKELESSYELEINSHLKEALMPE